MRYFFEHFGVAVGALSGVLGTEHKRVDLFGVTVLALVTGVGGGTARDIILNAPVFWIVDWTYVVNGALVAALTFLLAGRFPLPLKALDVADAMTLALFAVVGAAKALDYHVGPVNAVLLGVMTGIGGGIVRDVLLGEIPMVFRDSTFLYATAATIGCLFMMLWEWLKFDRQINMLLSMTIILLIRLAALRWKIRLPAYNPPRKPAGKEDTGV